MRGRDKWIFYKLIFPTITVSITVLISFLVRSSALVTLSPVPKNESPIYNTNNHSDIQLITGGLGFFGKLKPQENSTSTESYSRCHKARWTILRAKKFHKNNLTLSNLDTSTTMNKGSLVRRFKRDGQDILNNKKMTLNSTGYLFQDYIGRMMKACRSNFCDPDGLLDSNKSEKINNKLSDIQKLTKCPCDLSLCQNSSNGYLGFDLGIVIGRRFEIPHKAMNEITKGDLPNAQELTNAHPYNFCQPEHLDPLDRDDRIGMDRATVLLSFLKLVEILWRKNVCNNEIMFIYEADTRMICVRVGKRGQIKLEPAHLKKWLNRLREHYLVDGEGGDVYEALNQLTTKMYSELREFPQWGIIVICIGPWFIIGILLILYIYTI